MSLFGEHTLEQYAQAQADYMPQGKLWRAKNITDSKVRDLLRGLGASAKRQDDALNAFWTEVFIGTTEEFLPDFERALGIPDDCFTGAGTIDERRRDAQLKLVSLYVVDEQDFIDLAALLGFIITIDRPVEDTFPPYDVPFDVVSLKEVRFTWIVKGENIFSGVPPYDVPFDVAGSDEGNIMICLFQKLKPANTSLLFENT